MVALDLRALIRKEKERRAASATSTAGGAGTSKIPTAAVSATVSYAVSNRGSLNAEDYAVGKDIIQGLYYFPEFITAEEETSILRHIDAAPQSRWVAAGERRMLNFGGRPGTAAVAEALPGFLQRLIDAMVTTGLVSPHHAANHALINDYRGGSGIPPHRDGPLYPAVQTLSLGGPALLQLHRALDESTCGELVAQVMLQPRGLFLLCGEAYSGLLHSIESRPTDLVSEACCNCEAAGVAVGDSVPRAPRRISLVFVRKCLDAAQR